MKYGVASSFLLAGMMLMASPALAQKDSATTGKPELSQPPELSGGSRGGNGGEGEQGGRPPRPTKEQHEALKACAKKSGITLPDPGPDGPPPRPSEADRKVLDACMDAIGMKRPSGPPPEMSR